MRVIREVKIGERLVQVREMTVGEIRAWLSRKTEDLGDLIDVALFEDFSLGDVCAMTDLEAGDIDQLTPGGLGRVMDVAREINPDFFAMCARMVKMGRALTNAQGEEPPTLSEASPA